MYTTFGFMESVLPVELARLLICHGRRQPHALLHHKLCKIQHFRAKALPLLIWMDEQLFEASG